MAEQQCITGNTLAPAQYSTSELAGSLYRTMDGTWYWRADGTIARHVRDMRLGALLPRFKITNRYGKFFFRIPFAWREIYQWDGDLLAGRMLDELLRKQDEQLLIPSGAMEFVDTNDMRPVRKERVLGCLIAQAEFDKVADIPIPSWSAHDSVAVLSDAQLRNESGFLDDEDLQTECDTVRKRFFSARAREQFGAHAMRACEAWGIIASELRSLWHASESRFNLWELEVWSSRAWSELPPNFYLLSKADLWKYAYRFSPAVVNRKEGEQQ